MGRLEGKAAVVCGAGQTPGETLGNGRAMALLFAREGARVLCVDRVLERAEETAAMIGEAGGTAFALEADISRAEGAKAVVDGAAAQLGALDILVNNVGIGAGDAPAHLVEEAAFDRILAVNLKGAWLTSKAAENNRLMTVTFHLMKASSWKKRVKPPNTSTMARVMRCIFSSLRRVNQVMAICSTVTTIKAAVAV